MYINKIDGPSDSLLKDPVMEPNKKSLYWYSFVIGIAMFQCAWAVVGNTQTAPILIGKFGWDEQQAKFYNTMITAFPIIGLLFGGLVGGKIVTYGRSKTLLSMELLIIVASLIQQYLSIPTLIAGRFLLGFGSGVMNVAVSKSLYETVPESLSGTFGTLTNLYACIGGLIAALLGLILPHEPSLYKDD